MATMTASRADQAKATDEALLAEPTEARPKVIMLRTKMLVMAKRRQLNLAPLPLRR